MESGVRNFVARTATCNARNAATVSLVALVSDFSGESSEHEENDNVPGSRRSFSRFIIMSLIHNSTSASDAQSVTGISDRHRDPGSEGGELRLSEIFCEQGTVKRRVAGIDRGDVGWQRFLAQGPARAGSNLTCQFRDRYILPRHIDGSKARGFPARHPLDHSGEVWRVMHGSHAAHSENLDRLACK